MRSTWPIRGLIGLCIVAAASMMPDRSRAEDAKPESPKPTKVEKRNPEGQSKPRPESARKSSSKGAVSSKASTREPITTTRDRGQRSDTVRRPRFLEGCTGPKVPEEVRRAEETVRVRVRLLLTEDGVPVKAVMERSHPLVPDSDVVRCAMAQRFEPARLPDGTAVPYPYRRQFKFIAVEQLKQPAQKGQGKALRQRFNAKF